MGKLGGRSRQWLLDGLVNDYKPIPEYGLRVILAFSPRTSFLVPLDRCVQFAASAIKHGASSSGVIVALATWIRAGGGRAGLLFTDPRFANVHAATSEHQQQNAIRLVHVCLGTLMKAGIPRAAVMETSVAASAVQDALFTGR